MMQKRISHTAANSRNLVGLSGFSNTKCNEAVSFLQKITVSVKADSYVIVKISHFVDYRQTDSIKFFF